MAGLQARAKPPPSANSPACSKRRTKRKKILLVSTDVYRPAAIEQLRLLAEQVQADFFPSNVSQKPVEIARAALAQAKRGFYDVLMVDTAGRLAIDQE